MHVWARLLLREFEPHPAVAVGIVSPVLAHLDEQEQMDRRRDHLGDLAPRIGADRLDGLAALAEHDFALAFTLDIDRLLDADRAILELFPLIGLDRRLIRQLLMQAQIELLAR